MLVKVKLGDAQKFVKITELSLEEFLSAAFLKFDVPAVPENVKVFDESGTEVDDDVFEDVVRDPSVGVLTIKHGADLDSASPQASHGQSNQSLSSSIDSSDSQDTVIIEENSSSKQMKLDDEAKKSGTNIEEHLREITAIAQPYLLAMGPQKNSVHQYFIVLDRHAIPCKSTSSLGPFDELFKAHFVFGTSYNIMLHNMYTFIQTTVYNIDVGKVKEKQGCLARQKDKVVLKHLFRSALLESGLKGGMDMASKLGVEISELVY
ncbi:hypothetical protein M9458_056571 [Cirrhinus mrigala]|uniref:Uncharacterized protein n=1 Tax=Cirrhinus mrigala TaxID=683832 RepID=A0ABD0MHI0_CIRMR